MRTFRFAALALPLLAAASAQAADLPRRNYAPPPMAAPVYAAPVFSWTGFYAGLHAGYGWGSLGTVGNTTFGKPSGFVVGGTLGYNHQFDRFVLGVEGDLAWTNIDKSARTLVGGPPADTVVNSAEVKWMGTLRARAGYSIDRALLFVTGGYAGASLATSYNNITTPAAGSETNWRHGWAAGLGLEYAFTRHVSAKTEYIYTSFGGSNVFTGTAYASPASLSVSLVRAGVNYRF